jgi:hypothetical protein
VSELTSKSEHEDAIGFSDFLDLMPSWAESALGIWILYSSPMSPQATQVEE